MSTEPVCQVTPEPACATVYYDGACPLCTREVDFYRAQPGAGIVHFVDVSAGSDDIADDLTRRDALARFHVRGADGRLRDGAEAFATLWLALPYLRGLGKLVQQPWVLPFAEAAYRVFLKVRPLMQWYARRKGQRRMA